MDQELITSLSAEAAKFEAVVELDHESANELIDNLKNHYIKNDSALLWWESLKHPAKVIAYGDGDGLALMKSQMACVKVFLLVTDESPPPWKVFFGETADLIEMIAEQRFFEYCLASEDRSRLAFDTHHNEIVVCEAS